MALTQWVGVVSGDCIFLKVKGEDMLTCKRNGRWEFENITFLQSEHFHACIC